MAAGYLNLIFVMLAVEVLSAALYLTTSGRSFASKDRLRFYNVLVILNPHSYYTKLLLYGRLFSLFVGVNLSEVGQPVRWSAWGLRAEHLPKLATLLLQRLYLILFVLLQSNAYFVLPWMHTPQTITLGHWLFYFWTAFILTQITLVFIQFNKAIEVSGLKISVVQQKLFKIVYILSILLLMMNIGMRVL